MSDTNERNNQPSASAWYRFELCPGSWALEGEARKLGQVAHEEPSPEAERGTRIHAALAGEQVELSASEAETVRFLEERVVGEVKRVFGDKVFSPGAPFPDSFNEIRLWSPDRSFSGRVDRIYVLEDTALCIDWKSGFSEPVRAELNTQGKVLAVLAGIQWPALKTIYFQIISGAHGISEHRYDVAALYAAYEGVMATRRKLSSTSPLVPGEAQCRYCPGSLICPALKALSVSASQVDFNTLPDGLGAAQLLDRVVLALDYLEEIKSYYRNRMRIEKDYQIPGWGLESGPPRRSVSDWVAARERLLEFIEAKDLDKLVQFSIPATEALLGKAIGVKGKMLRDQYARILGNLLEVKTPEPTLKRN